MQIKIAIEEDLAPLAELFDEYRQSLGQPREFVKCYEFIQARLAENDSVILIAKQVNQLIGFIQLYPSYSSRLLMPIWFFDDIYVVEKYRKLGIATQLVQKAKELANEAKVLAVRHDNLPKESIKALEWVGLTLLDVRDERRDSE
ncbi:GNAT family N-acetyltransferase [Shewanella sp. AS1]|uniref:GNAT family N-acetyltransferase n=1 Tax=Shewanella sp. AS1 TaxID=2907626 RepID=UPI001F40A799|nr:GNAT family N-acetyltransferase [Shewanella sp. AS1]MCE9679501.1 GNAT family N-acetyltransferase [Shewanella sp. AS1]